MDKIDIRGSLHELNGLLRNNRIIDAYDLLLKMSKQVDDEFYAPYRKDPNEYRDVEK